MYDDGYDDIKNCCGSVDPRFTSPRGVSMASIDKGALDGDGRPVNPPEPTETPADTLPSVEDLTRVICYQFHQALVPCYNKNTCERLEASFQENLGRLRGAIEVDVETFYEDLLKERDDDLEDRVNSAIKERARGHERSHRAVDLARRWRRRGMT